MTEGIELRLLIVLELIELCLLLLSELIKSIILRSHRKGYQKGDKEYCAFHMLCI
jgi:hypothetical protein